MRMIRYMRDIKNTSDISARSAASASHGSSPAARVSPQKALGTLLIEKNQSLKGNIMKYPTSVTKKLIRQYRKQAIY